MVATPRSWMMVACLGLGGLGCRGHSTQAPEPGPSMTASAVPASPEPEPAEHPQPAPPSGPQAASSATDAQASGPAEDTDMEIVEVERVAIPDEVARFEDRVPRRPPGPDPADVEAALDRDIIRRIVREYRRALVACYETHDPQGRARDHLQQRWVFDGEWARAEFRWTDDGTRPPKALIGCLEDVTGRWRPPPPAGTTEPTPWRPVLPGVTTPTSPS